MTERYLTSGCLNTLPKDGCQRFFYGKEYPDELHFNHYQKAGNIAGIPACVHQYPYAGKFPWS
jgi:hypothetical protein